MTPLFTPKEVANLLKVSVGTLANWRMITGHALKHIIMGRNIRYRPKDIENFINGKIERDRQDNCVLTEYDMVDQAWYETHWKNGKCIKRVKAII